MSTKIIEIDIESHWALRFKLMAACLNAAAQAFDDDHLDELEAAVDTLLHLVQAERKER